MLVEISHGTISFGAETILSDINFLIKGTEKIAIVGRNGCGKTTLLNLIAGKIDLNKRDSDQDVFIARRGGLTIGYLQQNAFDDDSVTLEEEVKKAFQKILNTKSRLDELVELMENDAAAEIIQEYVDLLELFQNMGGYDFHPEFEPAKESYTDALNIKKLQIGYEQNLAEVSLEQKKGQKIGIIGGNGCGKSTLLRLCKIMSKKPNFLILDEPTNHMDILSKEALGNMLKNYSGTVLFVSHDRYFIKQVADTLLVFEDGNVKHFPEGYEQYQNSLKNDGS